MNPGQDRRSAQGCGFLDRQRAVGGCDTAEGEPNSPGSGLADACGAYGRARYAGTVNLR